MMTRFEAERIIGRELESGERLLWSGMPRQGIVLRAGDAFMVPFSLLWGGFAVFWEASVIAVGGPWFFALWGVPFVLVGLYMIFGRFIVDAKQRAATAYGLTDRRVVIVSGLRGRQVKSLLLRTISDVTLNERPGGSGTITLGPANPWAAWYGTMNWSGIGANASPALELIDDAKKVYDILRETQRTG